MSLTAPRNTVEVLCHAQKLRRTYAMKNGILVYPGAIAALDPATGLAENASQKEGLIVLGRADGFANDGRLIAKSGVFKLDNGSGEEALTWEDINRKVYILDDHTVGRIGGSAKVIAGVLRDLEEGITPIVEIGNINLD